MTISMMFTVHLYDLCVLFKASKNMASVLALKWHHWSFN